MCDGKDDSLSIQAPSLVIQNFDYDKLVPVVNIMRHRNGRWLNTHLSSVHERIEVNVRASRIIEAKRYTPRKTHVMTVKTKIKKITELQNF